MKLCMYVQRWNYKLPPMFFKLLLLLLSMFPLSPIYYYKMVCNFIFKAFGSTPKSNASSFTNVSSYLTFALEMSMLLVLKVPPMPPKNEVLLPPTRLGRVRAIASTILSIYWDWKSMGKPPLKTGPPVGFFLFTSFQSEDTLSNSFNVSFTVMLPPLAFDATEAALWYSPLI